MTTLSRLFTLRFLFFYLLSLNVNFLSRSSFKLAFSSWLSLLHLSLSLLYNPLPSNWDRKGNTHSTISTSFLSPFFYLFFGIPHFQILLSSFPITYNPANYQNYFMFFQKPNRWNAKWPKIRFLMGIIQSSNKAAKSYSEYLANHLCKFHIFLASITIMTFYALFDKNHILPKIWSKYSLLNLDEYSIWASILIELWFDKRIYGGKFITNQSVPHWA